MEILRQINKGNKDKERKKTNVYKRKETTKNENMETNIQKGKAQRQNETQRKEANNEKQQKAKYENK